MKKMNRRNFLRGSAVMALAAASASVLSGCSSSGSSGSSSASHTIAKTYTYNTSDYYDSVGWYVNMNTMLVLNADDTYDLYYKKDLFGTTDPGNKGNKTVIYSGTYTSAASADGDAAHLDITLAAPTRIYMEQHDKAFGRNAIAGNVMLDTANWTDSMTTVAFPAGSSDGAKDFLAKYAQEMSMTVEDPSLSPDDTSLSYRIVELPGIELEITGNE